MVELLPEREDWSNGMGCIETRPSVWLRCSPSSKCPGVYLDQVWRTVIGIDRQKRRPPLAILECGHRVGLAANDYEWYAVGASVYCPECTRDAAIAQRLRDLSAPYLGRVGALADDGRATDSS
jgi:hypothetical protein